MIIRKATKSDIVPIANCLLLVLDNMVYKFIGKKDYGLAKDFLIHFLKREHNQYSYQNCFVAEDDNEIVGVINIYNGSNLVELRLPILEFVDQYYNTNLIIEDETQAGEYYIDTIAVRSNKQGMGIGSKLLQHAIDTYVINMKQTLGLLVDKKNLKAKQLYLNKGFICEGKKVLLGHHMEHLQIK